MGRSQTKKPFTLILSCLWETCFFPREANVSPLVKFLYEGNMLHKPILIKKEDQERVLVVHFPGKSLKISCFGQTFPNTSYQKGTVYLVICYKIACKLKNRQTLP